MRVPRPVALGLLLLPQVHQVGTGSEADKLGLRAAEAWWLDLHGTSVGTEWTGPSHSQCEWDPVMVSVDEDPVTVSVDCNLVWIMTSHGQCGQDLGHHQWMWGRRPSPQRDPRSRYSDASRCTQVGTPAHPECREGLRSCQAP